MKKMLIGIVLLCLCYVVLENSFTRDFTSSIIPGWNTTIRPSLWGVSVILPWLAFVTLTYFIFLKKVIPKNQVSVYLCMTLPFVITISIVSVIAKTILKEPLSIIGWTPIIMVTLLLFVLAQIWFIIKLFSYTIKKPQ